MAPRVDNRQREQILEFLPAGIPKGEIADRVEVTKGRARQPRIRYAGRATSRSFLWTEPPEGHPWQR